MRNCEILFRGKQKDNSRRIRHRNGQWIYGSLIVLDEDHVFICPPCEAASSLSCQEFIRLNSVMVDPSTVGQYTGYRDIKRNCMFDGDILLEGGIAGSKRELCQVEMEYGCFRINRPGRYMPVFYAENPEIVGNIHDNPELLEAIRAKRWRYTDEQ